MFEIEFMGTNLEVCVLSCAGSPSAPKGFYDLNEGLDSQNFHRPLDLAKELAKELQRGKRQQNAGTGMSLPGSLLHSSYCRVFFERQFP